jgi:hypothetical protein
MTKQVRIAHGDGSPHSLRVRQYQTVANADARLVREAIVTDLTALAQMQIYGQADAEGAMFLTIDEAPAGAAETRSNVHGIVTGEDGVINATRLKLDAYGSFEHPEFPGVRLFEEYGYKLAATAQQRRNIRAQTSIAPDGTSEPSGPAPVGWAEVATGLQPHMVPLWRDDGNDPDGNKTWTQLDGHSDEKGISSYLYPRYRVRAGGSLEKIAEILRAAEARGVVLNRADASS